MAKLKQSLIALIVLPALVGFSLLGGMLTAPSSHTAAFEADKQKAPRKFYLTQTLHNGSQALSACAIGYHMASLWEIFDTSDLRYDIELGFTTVDSGLGPPSGSSISGWIRTGNDASPASGSLGQTNCNAWTSEAAQDVGTNVGLSTFWSAGTVSVISPWSAGVVPCTAPRSVWCVQD